MLSIAADANWIWNGMMFNTMTFEFRFESIYGIHCALTLFSRCTQSHCLCVKHSVNDTDRCELGENYFVPGTPCTVTGGSHFSLWNGARHDYQGAGAEGLYLYLSPCSGAHRGDMPFDVMAAHRSWKGAVRGIEYLVLALYGDDDDDVDLLFFSASFQSVIAGAEAVGPRYDDNVDSDFLTDLSPETENEIGSRFKLYALSLSLHSVC